jgi:hypothetical protein
MKKMKIRKERRRRKRRKAKSIVRKIHLEFGKNPKQFEKYRPSDMGGLGNK